MWVGSGDSLPKKRFVRHVCLRNSCLLWNLSLHSLPEAWGSWERQHAPPALHYGCISCIMLAKDRVVLSKLWITGYWLWSRMSYICDCCKSMKNCWDWAFSLCGLEVGLPAFYCSCPCSKNVIHCPKEICSTCLSKESMPFVKSKPPLPTRSLRSLRAVARSTSSALWLHQLHHAC